MLQNDGNLEKQNRCNINQQKKTIQNVHQN